MSDLETGFFNGGLLTCLPILITFSRNYLD